MEGEGEGHDEDQVNIAQYNEQVFFNSRRLLGMMTFHPTDRDRFFSILYRHVREVGRPLAYRSDLSYLPVWAVENINRHPEHFAGIDYSIAPIKQNAFHFLARDNIDLDAPTIDVVPDSRNCWVKKNEGTATVGEWECGVKKTYIWKKRPAAGRRNTRAGNEGNRRELYWRLDIYRLSDSFNINRFEQTVAIDPPRLGLWKLVPFSPTTRRNPRRRAIPQAAHAQADEAAPTVEEPQQLVQDQYASPPRVQQPHPAEPENDVHGHLNGA